jgi:hypothetical protein
VFVWLTYIKNIHLRFSSIPEDLLNGFAGKTHRAGLC